MSEPNYDTRKHFSGKLLAIEIHKTNGKMNKLVNISKIVIYDYWYEYLKPKYGKKAKICYMGIWQLFFYVKLRNICTDLPEDVEEKFDTSNCKVARPLSRGKS